MPDSPSPFTSPLLQAINRPRAPSMASVRSGKELVSSRTDQHTVFIPTHVYAFLTSPEHTVTACLANSTVDSSVRVIAEHLFGLEHDSFKIWTGGEKDEVPVKHAKHSVRTWLSKLHIKSKRSDPDKDESSKGSSETESEAELAASAASDDQWAKIKPLTTAQMAEVKQCGQWGKAEPGNLFLNIYAQALLTLEKNVLNGLVSPPLMGSSGVIPLTIISVIPDIIQHHADLIVRAEHEIFLATNFWEASGAAQTIVDAFKELSRRAISRGGQKVVIKLMYDRGTPSQIIHAHQPVDPDTYTGDKVKLPAPEEIPGCLLEVQNYHVPPVGTFHSKYMVIDRKIAILNSNNIQDRVNVELMVHLEGPIVQSIYDTALLSWWQTFNPPLPLLNLPPSYSEQDDRSQYSFGAQHTAVTDKGDLDAVAQRARQTINEELKDTGELVTVTSRPDSASSNPKIEKSKWDATNQAEATRVDDALTSGDSVNAHLNTGTKIESTDEINPSVPFRPIVLHTPHDPFPIALVNRSPRGRPGHGDTFVPQDQAWLAGFKFAKKNVFIQTPTFNAKPVVAAALDAARRGVLVEIYADLGFNDEGELLPFQGGTNEMVAAYMYSQLDEGEKDNLRIYWYTAKDQKTPLNAKDKSRNCHIKLMIIDGEVGIQGNGNQVPPDSQSWYHSQEINVLIDSSLVCGEWRDAIDANQNTLAYGRVDSHDGVWRDANGNTLPGQKAPPSGPFKSLVGVKGAVQRVRGEGGF